MQDDQPTHSNDTETNSSVPLSRRGVLAAGSALGLGLAASTGAASAQSDDDEDREWEGAPFADEDHDHAGDYLGESAPVGRIDVDEIVANSVSTTRYADSVAEVNEYIEDAPNRAKMSEKSGVKIVLREGTMEPDPDDLPIELKNGVVIEGQGEKVSRIDARGIGKPVFEYDRSGQTIGRTVVLRDFGVRGDGIDNSDGKGVPGSKGVLFDNVHFYLIENCSFLGLEEGVVLRGCWTGTIQNIHVDQCHRDGLRFKSTERMGSNDIQISDSEIKRSGRHDINIEGTRRPNGPARPAKGIALTGIDTSGAGKYGIRIVGGQGVSIDGCYTENNGGGRPLREGPDRDGDGDIDPVQIALSPYEDDLPTLGVVITGTSIGKAGPNTPRDIGIKLNNVDGVLIAGNQRWWYPDGSLVELGPEMENVTIRNNALQGPASHSVVTGPLDGSTIPPHELNGGVWETKQLGSLDQIAALAADYVDKQVDNGVEVVLTDSLGDGTPVIDGGDFPAGTLFRGVGMHATTVGSSSGSSPTIQLARPGQGLANLNVTGGETAVHVASSAEKSAITNVVCDGTIDVDGEGTRIVGADAPVDTGDVSAALDLSLDTGDLDPDATGEVDGGDSDPMARLTVTQDSPNHWRRMERDVTVNLDESPILAITVPEAVGRWNVALADGDDTAKLFDDSSNTGTFTADIASETGWSGESTFTVRLYAIRYDEPVYVDTIGIYDSTSAEAVAWEDEFASLSDEWNVRSGLDVEIVSEVE